MKRFLTLAILTATVLLAGCGAPVVNVAPTPAAPGPAAAPPLATETAPSASPGLPPSVPPAVVAPSVQPSSTQAQPAPPDTAAPAATPAKQMVKVFLIALEDNGKSGEAVGCGDRAVPVQVEVERTPGVLKAALEALLAIKQQTYGQSGLYNALYQSTLRVDGVAIQDGVATVDLSGSLLLGGECDNPRVEAQLTQTALQFSTVSTVAVFVNGKPLKDVLSLK